MLLTLIHWIGMYPLDSVNRPLNNWARVIYSCKLKTRIRYWQVKKYSMDI